MFSHELSCHKGGLLLSVLMLEDAGCNHYPVPGVDKVVSHESWHFADDGHKAFLAHLGHLLGVSYALVAPHCSVHSSLAYLRSTHGGTGWPRLTFIHVPQVRAV